jgi:5'-nucleotidase
VPGIAAVVGGHSHTLLSNTDPAARIRYPHPVTTGEGRVIPVVQAGSNNRHLGRLDLDLDAAGAVVAASGDSLPLPLADPGDAAMEALIAELALPLAALRARVIGTAAGHLLHEGCRRDECPLGNVIAEAMLAAARPGGAEVAIQNGGGIRSGIASGPITWGDVLSVLPFSNTLATMRLSGADLRAALEHGLSGAETAAGRFPQIAGLRLTWNPAAPPGARITMLSLVREDGRLEPIDDRRLYGVVTNNFLRAGGDGYAMFRDNAIDPYDQGKGLEDAVEAWLAGRGPVRPGRDGRLSRL